jgi:two-component system, OmpR family, sensor histidine kinase TctE
LNAPLSLRRGLLRRLLPPVTLVLVLNSALGYWVGHYFANKVYDQWLLDSALSLKRQVRTVADRAVLDLSAGSLDLFAFDEIDHVYFDVVTPNGGKRTSNIQFCRAPINDTSADRIEFFNTTLDGKFVRAVQVNDQISGVDAHLSSAPQFNHLTICVAETTRKRLTLQNELMAALFIPQAGLIFAIGLAVWRAVSSTTDSLRDVVRLVREQPQTRMLSSEITEKAPVEVRPLLDELNDLIAAVRISVEHERRFIDHAAHQLRTPLAALRIDLETMHGSAAHLLEPNRQALYRSLNAARRLDHLLAQLLLLARIDAGESKALVMLPIDLNRQIHAIEVRMIDGAISAKKEITLNLSSIPIIVKGIEVLLDEMITNLIDNALHHSPSGSVISVTTDWAQRSLCVSNPGAIIAPSILARMGERFFRGAPEQSSGSGLGLSIVKEIANIHSAGMTILAQDTGGLSVTITFPADAS